ncbi:hypothetical protein ABZW30_29595 [Kitasatospora sp. NPDC004669]|uniref:hypothetical protein n=1 Tax=Kitasatospora sp. NPDC004669 TaxID=3154555 RepID=UPI0033B1A1FF
MSALAAAAELIASPLEDPNPATRERRLSLSTRFRDAELARHESPDAVEDTAP